MVFRIHRVDRKLTISYVVMFALIYLSCGYVFTHDIASSAMTIALWVVTLILCVLSIERINKRVFQVFLILVVLLWLSVLINGEDVLRHIKLTFGIGCAFLFSNNIDSKSFKEIFIDIMYFLAITSLIFFIVFLIFPRLKNAGYIYSPEGYNKFLLYNPGNSIRNASLFWEPGAFQTFLFFALLFETFREKQRTKRVIVFIIAIISTLSTTGLITLFLYIIMILFSKKTLTKKTRIAFILLAGILVFMSVSLSSVSDLLFVGENSVFGKIQYFVEGRTTNEASSAGVRYYSIVKPLEGFLQNPLIGLGYDGIIDFAYRYTFGMNTCTVINYFAYYGVFFGICAVKGLWRFFSSITTERVQKCFVLIIMLLCMISEDFSIIPFCFSFIFLGYKTKNGLV